MNIQRINTTIQELPKAGHASKKPFAKDILRKMEAFENKQSLTKEERQDPHFIGSLSEAFFYRLIFKSMREEKMDNPLFDSSQMEQVQEMQDDLTANFLGSEGRLGFTKLFSVDAEKEYARATPNA